MFLRIHFSEWWDITLASSYAIMGLTDQHGTNHSNCMFSPYMKIAFLAFFSCLVQFYIFRSPKIVGEGGYTVYCHKEEPLKVLPTLSEPTRHSPERWGVSANTVGDKVPHSPSREIPSGLVRTWIWYCFPGDKPMSWHVWLFITLICKRQTQARYRWMESVSLISLSTSTLEPLSSLAFLCLDALWASCIKYPVSYVIPWKGVAWNLQLCKELHRSRNHHSWWVGDPRSRSTVLSPWAIQLLYSLVEQ